MHRLALLSFLLFSPLGATAAADTPQGRCEGWPRLVLKTPPGTCVALVAGAPVLKPHRNRTVLMLGREDKP